MAQQNPTVGRIVHYTIQRRDDPPETRAAIVCRDWGNGCVNLRVVLDGRNDDGIEEWVTSRLPSAAVDGGDPGTVPQLGCWNWPPRA